MLTVADIAARFSVDDGKVLAWIRRGELAAVNVANKRGGRPRWRISIEALEAFEAARTTSPPSPVTRRRRASPDVIQFF